MSVAVEPCDLCRGTGQAERLEERRGEGWAPNDQVDPGLADAWIAHDPAAPLRWRAVRCPRCGGRGQVVIEYVRCRIF